MCRCTERPTTSTLLTAHISALALPYNKYESPRSIQRNINRVIERRTSTDTIRRPRNTRLTRNSSYNTRRYNNVTDYVISISRLPVSNAGEKEVKTR